MIGVLGGIESWNVLGAPFVLEGTRWLLKVVTCASVLRSVLLLE